MDEEKFPLFPSQSEEERQKISESNNEVNDFGEKIQKEQLNQLLNSDFETNSPFSKAYLQDYTRNIGYLAACCNDDRFDLLTEPKKLYNLSDLISFRIDFYNDTFIIKDSNNMQAKSFDYGEKSIEVLESLQNMKLYPDLFTVFSSLGVKHWDSGKIIINATDYRHNPPLSFVFPIEIDQNIVRNFIQTKTLEQKTSLEMEKEILKVRFSAIATDPSPDVARFNSVIENKQRMWCYQYDNKQEIKKKNNKKTEKNTEKTTPKSSMQGTRYQPIKKTQPITPDSPIKLPPKIFSLFNPKTQKQ